MCCSRCLQPLRDMSVHAGDLLNSSNAKQAAASIGSTLIRVALAVIGFIAGTMFPSVSIAAPIVFAIGAVISLPATLIAAGSIGIGWGVAMTILGLAYGAFATAGAGLLALAAGVIAIQKHKALRIGIAELCLA